MSIRSSGRGAAVAAGTNDAACAPNSGARGDAGYPPESVHPGR
jgi:hypothetical protein